mgnify:CR=1 FL=1
MAKEGNGRKVLRKIASGAASMVGGVQGVVENALNSNKTGISEIIKGATEGMPKDSIPFRDGFIDRIKASNQARNEGVKVNKILTKKGGSFKKTLKNK